VRSTGGENIDQQGYCGGKQSLESGVECGKEQRFGDGVFRILCIKRSVFDSRLGGST
jgi:hypothetical protein